MGSVCQKSNRQIQEPTQLKKNNPTIHSIVTLQRQRSSQKFSPSKDKTTTSVQDIRKIYRFDKKILGSGQYGTVRKAWLKTNPHKFFAVKTISKEKIKKNLHMLKRELEILKTLDHPNIIKFYETYQDERFFHLVMEYADGGELLERICQEKHLSEPDAAKLMKKMISAVVYLHDRGICHRDLKPENFLFSSRESDAEIKLIDFGLSKQFAIDSHGDQLANALDMKTVVGTALYVSPEVLSGKYDQRCDDWSLGVIMYVLLTGNPPFLGTNNNEIFGKIMRGKVQFNDPEWKNISKQAIDLIKKLLKVDPKKRLSSQNALKHEWFNLMINKNKEIEVKDTFDPNIINLMRNFRSEARFKTEALKVLVSFLTEDEIKQLKSAFRSIDTDNSGRISFQELKDVMTQYGYKEPEQEICNIMDNLHLNIDDEINYSDFIALTLDKRIYLTKEKLWQTFKYFDVENQNKISAANIKEAMARSGRKMQIVELQQWIKQIDSDKNGTIDFDEFIEMMKDDKITQLSDDINDSSPTNNRKGSNYDSRQETPGRNDEQPQSYFSNTIENINNKTINLNSIQSNSILDKKNHQLAVFNDAKEQNIVLVKTAQDLADVSIDAAEYQHQQEQPNEIINEQKKTNINSAVIS